jgi:RNA polymerase sigma-70 factor, ECF subfamily
MDRRKDERRRDATPGSEPGGALSTLIGMRYVLQSYAGYARSWRRKRTEARRGRNDVSPGPEGPFGNEPTGDAGVNAFDDGTLYDRWLDHRDGDAFAELARRHSPVVYDLTCRVLGDRAGAEDVLQDALLSLALERSRRPVEVGVVAWLARLAICRARNRRSSERSRARRQIVVGQERPEESMPDERLERGEELERALSGCDPDDRALLAMRYLHGWEYDRIARGRRGCASTARSRRCADR